MSQSNKHWIAHTACAVIIVFLLQTILSDSKPAKIDSGVSNLLSQENQNLRDQNDSLSQLSSKLIEQVNAPSPQPKIEIKYIERNERIKLAADSSLIDSFIAITSRHRAARLARGNE